MASIMCETTNEQIKQLEIYLRNLYQGIVPEESGVKGYADPLDQRFLDEFINDPLKLREHNFHKLCLEKLKIDNGYPVAWRDEHGKILFVQLRKIDKTKLLVGCGNNPTSICFHHPINQTMFDKECCNYGGYHWGKSIIHQCKYQLEQGITHKHKEYITIDPNIAVNPTIVGFFGWYEIPDGLIPSGSLEDIVSEGINLTDLKNFSNDFLRLTGKGSVYRDIS